MKDVTYAMAYADDMLANTIYNVEGELEREIEGEDPSSVRRCLRNIAAARGHARDVSLSRDNLPCQQHPHIFACLRQRVAATLRKIWCRPTKPT